MFRFRKEERFKLNSLKRISAQGDEHNNIRKRSKERLRGIFNKIEKLNDIFHQSLFFNLLIIMLKHSTDDDDEGEENYGKRFKKNRKILKSTSKSRSNSKSKKFPMTKFK